MSELILREGDRICAYFILVYILKLKVTTLSSRHLFEGFALRSTANNDQCVYFILRGNALGKKSLLTLFIHTHRDALYRPPIGRCSQFGTRAKVLARCHWRVGS